MKIIFELRHPAHYHHFKYLISHLKGIGHQVRILISSKDILVNLLEMDGLSFAVIGRNRSGLFHKIAEVVAQDVRFIREIREFQPDLVVGRPSHPLSFTTWLLRKDRIIYAEDDFKVIFLNALAAYPFARFILAPVETDLGWFGKKKIPYYGNQKLAYLHPKVFRPDPVLLRPHINTDKPYYIIRLSRLSATHDIHIQGITDDLCRKIIRKLNGYGEVYISSERQLPEDLSGYRLQVPENLIHHVLAFAEMLIGDSQSMAFEAALLGSPAIRYNSLGDKLKILMELEFKYGLLYNIHSRNVDKLWITLDMLLSQKDLKSKHISKRDAYLESKINVSEFMCWFTEQYPDSLNCLRTDPDYQFRFK